MSYKFTFADNEVYTATDVNNITKRLVTEGVEDVFLDGDAYNVSQFNEAGKLLYTSGTVPESYTSLKVTKASDTEILINPGTAFFSDGAVIEIEAGGETLSFVSGSKNYVYLQNDLINTNKCYPACSVNLPTGDYVMLAEIDESGKITDKRTYARGKLPGYQSVAGSVLRLQESIPMTTVNSTRSEGSKIFDIGNNNFEYILVYVKHNSYSLPCLGIYDVQNQLHWGFACYNEETGYDSTTDTTIHHYYQATVSENSLYTQYRDSKSTQITFSLDNGELTVMVTDAAGKTTCNIDLILF